MDSTDLFKQIVEPGLARIPVIVISHVHTYGGREHKLTQILHQNIFTEFDERLSDYLAATGRQTFPSFTVTIETDRGDAGQGFHLLGTENHCSAPHALRQMAARVMARKTAADVILSDAPQPGNAQEHAGARRRIEMADIADLDAALTIADLVGESEFLEVSGDFDVIVILPPGNTGSLVIHPARGTVSLRAPVGKSTASAEWPLHGFKSRITTDNRLQDYLAASRRAIVNAKGQAIQAFRSAAETRIEEFHRALAGRSLEGYRLTIGKGLVDRLTTGLGDQLNGLSEGARITALDWHEATARMPVPSRAA